MNPRRFLAKFAVTGIGLATAVVFLVPGLASATGTTITVPSVDQYDPTSAVVGTLAPYIPVVIGIIASVAALALAPKIVSWAYGRVLGFFRSRKATA